MGCDKCRLQTCQGKGYFKDTDHFFCVDFTYVETILRSWQTRTHCCGHIVAHDVSWAAQTGKDLLRTQSASGQNRNIFRVRNRCCARANVVQSLNSPFFPPHIGAEPGRSKEESRNSSPGVLTIYTGKPEIPVGKSNGSRHSVWEASENMGCNVR